MMTPDRFEHYRLNIDELDSEHIHIFQLMDGAIEDLRAGKMPEAKEKILSLIEVIKQHNINEELYMGQIYFPYMAAHKTAHGTLVSRLISMLENDLERYTTFSIATLEEHLINHIDHFDRQYADYAKSPKQSSTK